MVFNFNLGYYQQQINNQHILHLIGKGQMVCLKLGRYVHCSLKDMIPLFSFPVMHKYSQVQPKGLAQLSITTGNWLAAILYSFYMFVQYLTNIFICSCFKTRRRNPKMSNYSFVIQLFHNVSYVQIFTEQLFLLCWADNIMCSYLQLIQHGTNIYKYTLRAESSRTVTQITLKSGYTDLVVHKGVN